MITPVSVHGHAGLPVKVVSVHILDAFRRDDLLRSYEIAVVGFRIARSHGTVAHAAGLQAVVDDDARLQPSHHIDQIGSSPGLSIQIVVGEVKP